MAVAPEHVHKILYIYLFNLELNKNMRNTSGCQVKLILETPPLTYSNTLSKHLTYCNFFQLLINPLIAFITAGTMALRGLHNEFKHYQAKEWSMQNW